MKQIYTEDDVIRFTYGEMDEEEYEQFFNVLCKDEELWVSYEQMKEVKATMDAFPLLEPDAEIDRHILAEAGRVASGFRKSSLRPLAPVALLTLFSFSFSLGLFWNYQDRFKSQVSLASAETDWIRTYLSV